MYKATKSDLTPLEALSIEATSQSPAGAAYHLTHILMGLSDYLKAAAEDSVDGLPVPGVDAEREAHEWNRLAVLCEATATMFDNLAPTLTHD